MNLNFYKDFEDKFRGECSLIKARLKIYLDFILPLREIHTNCSAIDLGCGRGEWLEILKENGIPSIGVDLDEEMLRVCQRQGLSVQLSDATNYLEQLPSSSQSIISGFHLVEHLPFPKVEILIKNALRVLRPAGLLILETPNPENIIVGSSHFYLDPTHQRPVPPHLLSFLVEYQGFNRVKILRLQEAQGLLNKDDLGILDVLGGVSPDYAIVAQKDANDEALSLINDCFSKEYGITIEQIAKKYDQQNKFALQDSHQQCQQLDVALQDSQQQCQQLEIALQDSQQQRQQLEIALQDSQQQRQQLEIALQDSQQQRQQLEITLQDSQQQRQQLEIALQDSQQQRQQLEIALQDSRQQRQQLEIALQDSRQQREHIELMFHALINSRSMRVTTPLRVMGHYARNLRDGFKRFLNFFKTFIKQRLKQRLIRLSRWILSKPWLKKISIKLLTLFPHLKSRLKSMMLRDYSGHVSTNISSIPEFSELDQLSPRAQQIYKDLKIAISPNKNKNQEKF